MNSDSEDEVFFGPITMKEIKKIFEKEINEVMPKKRNQDDVKDKATENVIIDLTEDENEDQIIDLTNDSYKMEEVSNYCQELRNENIVQFNASSTEVNNYSDVSITTELEQELGLASYDNRTNSGFLEKQTNNEHLFLTKESVEQKIINESNNCVSNSEDKINFSHERSFPNKENCTDSLSKYLIGHISENSDVSLIEDALHSVSLNPTNAFENKIDASCKFDNYSNHFMLEEQIKVVDADEQSMNEIIEHINEMETEIVENKESNCGETSETSIFVDDDHFDNDRSISEIIENIYSTMDVQKLRNISLGSSLFDSISVNQEKDVCSKLDNSQLKIDKDFLKENPVFSVLGENENIRDISANKDISLDNVVETRALELIKSPESMFSEISGSIGNKSLIQQKKITENLLLEDAGIVTEIIDLGKTENKNLLEDISTEILQPEIKTENISLHLKINLNVSERSDMVDRNPIPEDISREMAESSDISIISNEIENISVGSNTIDLDNSIERDFKKILESETDSNKSIENSLNNKSDAIDLNDAGRSDMSNRNPIQDLDKDISKKIADSSDISIISNKIENISLESKTVDLDNSFDRDFKKIVESETDSNKSVEILPDFAKNSPSITETENLRLTIPRKSKKFSLVDRKWKDAIAFSNESLITDQSINVDVTLSSDTSKNLSAVLDSSKNLQNSFLLEISNNKLQICETSLNLFEKNEKLFNISNKKIEENISQIHEKSAGNCETLKSETCNNSELAQDISEYEENSVNCSENECNNTLEEIERMLALQKNQNSNKCGENQASNRKIPKPIKLGSRLPLPKTKSSMRCQAPFKISSSEKPKFERSIKRPVEKENVLFSPITKAVNNLTKDLSEHESLNELKGTLRKQLSNLYNEEESPKTKTVEKVTNKPNDKKAPLFKTPVAKKILKTPNATSTVLKSKPIAPPKSIVSPIGMYIHKTPKSPLIVKVDKTNSSRKKVVREFSTEIGKKPAILKEKIDSPSLPFCAYKSAPTVEVIERTTKLPKSVSKFFPPEQYVIRHESRIKSGNKLGTTKLSSSNLDNSAGIFNMSTGLNDVSVHVKKSAF